MNSLDEILNRLQGQQPLADDEERLIEEIMECLPDKKQTRHRFSLWKSISLSAASVAAALLLVAYVNRLNKESNLSVVQYTDCHKTVCVQFDENSTRQDVYEYYMERKSQQLKGCFGIIKNLSYKNS